MFNGTEAIITRNHPKLQHQLFDPSLLAGFKLQLKNLKLNFIKLSQLNSAVSTVSLTRFLLYFLYTDTVMTFFGLIPAQQSSFVSALLYK